MYFLIYCGFLNAKKISSEAVARRCSVKKVFLEISQDSQESTCARVSHLTETLAQVFSCKFCKISKNTFFFRTCLAAASVSFLKKFSENQIAHNITKISLN